MIGIIAQGIGLSIVPPMYIYSAKLINVVPCT